ncbi:YihY/virulence factor BrkB family protein [Metasolibacillus meyeri]|uniref:YihY/virulence factor BrkB family protein n=1 Tax=Metasolibacillus meyeri TaxID=1071052 RepID=A0AAW9NTX8_9BACL|nr:YihY/virulence factor BrkB family protein [Metasolibacillus meyeri]MEC1179683.1 YihY/virulence factor BrkB family protein [Metasolibacillus meyeri]
MKELKKNASSTLAFWKSFVAPAEADIDVTTTKGFFQDIFVRVKRADISGMGAQLAYFFLLSFFPLLIFLVTLLPYLNLQRHQVFEFMADIMPEEVYVLTENIVGEILTTSNSGLLSLGIIGTIWSASRGIDALIKGLNRAYDVEGRSGVVNRLWALLFTLAFIALILIALVFPVFGKQIGSFVFSYIGIESSFESMWTLLRWLMPNVIIFAVLTLMYWIIPNTEPRLTLISIIPGAILATAGWLALSYGFSFYVGNFSNFGATYGSIAGVIVLMLWLYLTGMILILGGLLNAALQNRHLAKKAKQDQKIFLV